MVRDVYRQYIQSKRELFEVAEACSIKGWPDRKAAVQVAFRIQNLLNEQEALRFEYLIEKRPSESASWESLTSISKRLDEGWNTAEDEILKENNPA